MPFYYEVRMAKHAAVSKATFSNIIINVSTNQSGTEEKQIHLNWFFFVLERVKRVARET